MIIYVIPPLKQRVNEDFLVHTSVYFSEVVHVELPDERVHFRVSEVAGQDNSLKLVDILVQILLIP